jgi:hypothetical protein
MLNNNIFHFGIHFARKSTELYVGRPKNEHKVFLCSSLYQLSPLPTAIRHLKSLSLSVFASWFIIGVDRGEMCNLGSVGEQAGDRLPPLVFIPWRSLTDPSVA